MESDDEIKLYAEKLIGLYILVLSTSMNDERISFTDLLKFMDVKYLVYDYIYDGNEETTYTVIAFEKDVFKLTVNKQHWNNDVTWSIIK